MPDGELWSALVTAVNPGNTKAMPVVFQSTVDLLETELLKARAALQEIQPNAVSFARPLGDEATVGAMAAYRNSILSCAPDFSYGTRRMTVNELGLLDENSAPGDAFDNKEELSGGAIKPNPPSLVDVLSNSLILDHMAPHLGVSSLLKLTATSRVLRAVVLETPYVFRHLDLTRCRGAQMAHMEPLDSGGQVWRSERMDESLTEDEFYSGLLRGIFSNLQRRSILQDVRTLVLDGLSVPADLIGEIILTDRFNVTILSIRDCLHLNERKLMQTLQYAVRPTRPRGTPRVKGIYHFSPMSSSSVASRSKYRDWWTSRTRPTSNGTSPSQRSASEDSSSSKSRDTVRLHPQNEWYSPSGKIFKKPIEDGWAQTLQKCQGIISFDAILCRGPRHNVDLYSSMKKRGIEPDGPLLGPAVATIALGPTGCDGCHSSPEGPAVWRQSPEEFFPLLSPLPLHSSTVAVAKRPALFPDEHPALIARCADCMVDRWCHRCHKWFCSNCLPYPEHINVNLSPHQTAVRGRHGSSRERSSDHPALEQQLKPGVSRDCWECGPTCARCKADCQRVCEGCQGDYCIEHNEGCSSTMCDWCNTSSRRRMRALY